MAIVAITLGNLVGKSRFVDSESYVVNNIFPDFRTRSVRTLSLVNRLDSIGIVRNITVESCELEIPVSTEHTELSHEAGCLCGIHTGNLRKVLDGVVTTDDEFVVIVPQPNRGVARSGFTAEEDTEVAPVGVAVHHACEEVHPHVVWVVWNVVQVFVNTGYNLFCHCRVAPYRGFRRAILR